MNTTNHKHLSRLLLLTAIVGLYGCRADVDLNNIDTRMEAEMGIALPVGNMLFTTNDFLGGGQVNKICVDQEGVFHYFDTLKMNEKEYHPIILSDYINTMDTAFYVKSQLQQKIDESGWVKDSEKGKPIELTFPLKLKLGSLNSDPSYERLDSIQIPSSVFNSNVIVTPEFDLKWSWINSINLVLKDQFHRQKGKTISIYQKGDGYNAYGENIPVTIDEFSVWFIQQGTTERLNSCEVEFVFNFTVPTTEHIQIFDQSAFAYHFDTQSINFAAAWGYFQSSNQMRDRDVVSIDSLWSDWKNMKKMKMKLMEPAVTIEAFHHVAAPLIAYLDTIMATNATEKVSASWNGETKTQFELTEVLSPYSPDLNDSVKNDHYFNHEPDKGHLDQLFLIRPDTLMYSYRIAINPNKPAYYPWDQHRVTPNTTVSGHAIIDVPFKVDKESEIEYVTKITDVQFNQVNLDSLLKSVKVIEKSQAQHIKLYMMLENSLPFMVNAKVWFLAQDSSEVDLHLFEGQDLNEITLPAPKMGHNKGEKYGFVSEASTTTFIVDVNKEQFDILNQCKHMKLDAYMGSNPEPCKIDTANSIKVYLGVAADVKAIINLQKK